MIERGDWLDYLKRFAPPPLHPEAWRTIPIFLLVMLVLFWIWTPLGWIWVAVTIWCTLLFREPGRVAPMRPDYFAIAPVDGHVIEIGSAAPPSELGLEPGDRLCIVIRPGPFDPHGVRIPVTGRIDRLARPMSGLGEDRLALSIAGAEGMAAMVAVAGGLGRRLVSTVTEGRQVLAGERFGLILYAGHVELYLPAGTAPAVTCGQRAVAGETILAEMAGL